MNKSSKDRRKEDKKIVIEELSHVSGGRRRRPTDQNPGRVTKKHDDGIDVSLIPIK